MQPFSNMQSLLDLLLPIAIGVIMFGIGMDLTSRDFKRVFIAPKAVLFGLFGQLVLMAAIGFGVAYLFPLKPVYQLGIVLIAACPGGTSSNIVSYMLKGRVALSVSITAFNSFLIVFTIPLILKLAFLLFWPTMKEINISMLDTLSEVIYSVLLPVVAGIIVRHYFPKFVEGLKKPLRFILPGILFVIFLLVIIVESKSGENSFSDYKVLILPAFFLNIFVMFVGFFSSKAIRLDHRDSYTIAIEMGLQNSALAIFLANNVIKIDGLSLIAVIYGSFSFFSTFLVAYLMKNYFHKKKHIVTD